MTSQNDWEIFQERYDQRERNMRSEFELCEILRKKAEREINK